MDVRSHRRRRQKRRSPVINTFKKQQLKKYLAFLNNVLAIYYYYFFFDNPGVPHLRGSFPWEWLGSGPLHLGVLYLDWGQGPTPSTAFGDRMGSSPPPGVEPVSMTIGPQGPYQVSYLIPSKRLMKNLLALNEKLKDSTDSSNVERLFKLRKLNQDSTKAHQISMIYMFTFQSISRRS